MNTYKEIKAALPDIDAQKVRDISEELDRILTLKTVFTSDGGKVMLEHIKNNCSIALRKSIIAAKNGDEKLLTANILDYSANIDLLSTLQDISLEEEIRTQLDDAVKEAMRT